MSKRKYVAPEFATGRNPHRVAAVQARRRSSAAGAHNPLPRRFRTRSTVKRAAIEEN